MNHTTPQEIESGQRNQWGLLKLLGEGDAGQVFLVESVEDGRIAILKRPHRSAFRADILRQASQIYTEGRILHILRDVFVSRDGFRFRVPDLLDHSVPENESSERYFIVLEKAPGFDLGQLARVARFGLRDSALDIESFKKEERAFLNGVAVTRRVPRLVILRALHGLLELLDIIHKHPAWQNGEQVSGVIWNDVKPNHLFWDPKKARLTIIDWGNGQFLGPEGTTSDRLFTPADDERQFVEEFRNYLFDVDRALLGVVKWPDTVPLKETSESKLKSVGESIYPLLIRETRELDRVRQREEDLIRSLATGMEQLQELAEVRKKIISFGELPDYAAAVKFGTRLATVMAAESKYPEFIQVCERISEMPTADENKWRLLERVGELAIRQKDDLEADFRGTLNVGLDEDWFLMLWNLCSVTKDDLDPSGWHTLADTVRRMVPEINPETATPLVEVYRLYQALKDEHTVIKGQGLAPQTYHDVSKYMSTSDVLNLYEMVINKLRDEVITMWIQLEPGPPDTNIEYKDIGEILDTMNDVGTGSSTYLDERLNAVSMSLTQPKAQVEIILDAWEAKGFDTARRGLHNLLLWDPDRRRVLQTDEAIRDAPRWMEKLHKGPDKGEHLKDFTTHLEFEGRKLRTVVGPANWLESLLNTLSELREGKDHGEIFAAHPQLSNDMPWLRSYEPEAMPPQEEEPDTEDTKPDVNADEARGKQKLGLGHDQGVFLTEPLDTWTPEARGSSARVFLGFIRNPEGYLKQAAVKIMRPDKVEYALPLFHEEARILSMMVDVPGISRLEECGFIKIDDEVILPDENGDGAARHITGEALRIEPDEVESFLDQLESHAEQGWLPYLAIERKSNKDNLMVLSDIGHTSGQYLPVEDALQVALKILDIVSAAHGKNIVYQDHKILHYYWNQTHNGVFVIDWNVAKWHPKGLSEAERQFDLVQFGARTLHHLLTGRPAPGALPLGPTRPEEIEMAPHTYPVKWTYDDQQRLSDELREILERVLDGGYICTQDLQKDLEQSLTHLTNVEQDDMLQPDEITDNEYNGTMNNGKETQHEKPRRSGK